MIVVKKNFKEFLSFLLCMGMATIFVNWSKPFKLIFPPQNFRYNLVETLLVVSEEMIFKMSSIQAPLK